MSGIDTATVTLTLGQLQELQTKIVALEKEIADARRTIDSGRLGDPESSARALSTTLTDSLAVVRFAVANLDPLTVRGWPYDELRRVGAAIATLPGVSDFVRELSNTLVEFANRAEGWEQARAEGKEQERLASENSRKGAFSMIPEDN